MHGPAVVGWLLTGLLGVTGLYCLARSCRRGAAPAQRGLDGTEALKGLGMAAMAAPYGSGRGVPLGVWALLFGGAALWSLRAGVRRGAAHRGHHLYHGVGHLAMAYMAVAAAGASGMAGMADMPAMGGLPVVTGALLLFFGGYALLSGVRLISPATADLPAGGPGSGSVAMRLLGAPELPHACRMVLGLCMFTMLLAM